MSCDAVDSMSAKLLLQGDGERQPEKLFQTATIRLAVVLRLDLCEIASDLVFDGILSLLCSL